MAINGYWPGVEIGWPQSHPNGYGMLGKVRGTLDGTPMDKDFPRLESSRSDTADTKMDYDKIGGYAYATEGWAVSNRGWLATLTFSSLHAIQVRFTDAKGKNVSSASNGSVLFAELRAPLNVDPMTPDTGWVEWVHNGKTIRLVVTETGNDTGVFRAQLPESASGRHTLAYGYWGFRKTATININ